MIIKDNKHNIVIIATPFDNITIKDTLHNKNTILKYDTRGGIGII